MNKDDEEIAKDHAMEALGFHCVFINYYHCRACSKDWTLRFHFPEVQDQCDRCGRDYRPSFYEKEWFNGDDDEE